MVLLQLNLLLLLVRHLYEGHTEGSLQQAKGQGWGALATGRQDQTSLASGFNWTMESKTMAKHWVGRAGP